MKIIPLTQGKQATVDDVDFKRLSKHKWFAMRTQSGKWYATRRIRKGHKIETVYMHREIAIKMGVGALVHKDLDGLNNRRKNLVACTVAQRIASAAKLPGKISRYKWVTFIHGKWEARLRRNGVWIYGGRFTDEAQAGAAAAKLAKEIYGGFANTTPAPK
jgi:hypothetical protein